MNDPTVKSVVVEQTKQWSDMMEKHRKEEWEIMKNHLKMQEDVLKKLMETAQAQQMKDLDNIMEKENKEMRARQARCSIENARDIQNDKALKSKAEKERRLNEKHSNNTKIFMDERRTYAIKHEKRREKLRKVHELQMQDLLSYMQSVR